MEPLVQGAAGMLLQPRGWLKGLETLCRKHDEGYEETFLIKFSTLELAEGFKKIDRL